MQLVLSLFPGIDLLGRGFEAEGFSVVRGPDLLWGADVRSWHAPAGKFDGVIAGSPCQDFSKARRSAPSGEGIALLREFCRIVGEVQPAWFLMENVPSVPDLRIAGYSIQRFDLDAREVGMRQRRRRHFQFGSRDGIVIVIRRRFTSADLSQERTCLASEGKREGRRTWADFCELQGLPRDFDLAGWPRAFKYAAVGNGVPIPMASAIALAICDAATADKAWSITDVRFCACRCGRLLAGRQQAATAACRKRLERARRSPRPVISL
jgi:DNA (cytosine-5)-methyltransferase 1